MMLKYQEFKIYEETINRLAQGLIKISENKKIIFHLNLFQMTSF